MPSGKYTWRYRSWFKWLDIGSSIRISSVKLPQDTDLTITDRDFVVATIAAPTIVKEPENPAEEETAEGAEGAEGTEAAAASDGEKPATDSDKKDGDDKKGADKKPAEEKK